MEIILRDNIANLGERGTVVTVADGYARNYLIPKGLAVKATNGAKKMIDAEIAMKEKRTEKEKLNAAKLQEELKEVSITISANAGENDQLFGSVTAQNIAQALQDKGHQIDKKQVNLEAPIKQLGVYDIELILAPEVAAPIKLWMAKE